MRTLCDVCESAAAILFCAADEAALCRACDDKVIFCFFSNPYLCFILEIFFIIKKKGEVKLFWWLITYFRNRCFNFPFFFCGGWLDSIILDLIPEQRVGKNFKN